MLSQEDVLRTVQQHGPVIANKIKQVLEQPDATLINVYLSELKADGKIKLSHTQLGSSPFAYTPKQKQKLEALIEHLNEKDRRTAKKLKEEGLIRKSTADPLTRVSLQNIKDFAVPIRVKTNEGEDTFYRYFLLSPEEAQERIKRKLGKKEPVKKEQTAEEKKKPQKEEVPKPKQESTPKEQQAEEKEESKKEEPVKRPTEPEKRPQKTKAEKQQTLERPDESEFAQQLRKYFSSNDIAVKSLEEVRKNSEVDCVIEVPSKLATITFFCKARNKKRSNDGDLAAAILAAKMKQLPAMYYTTGNVTKKAKKNPQLKEITVIEDGNTN